LDFPVSAKGRKPCGMSGFVDSGYSIVALLLEFRAESSLLIQVYCVDKVTIHMHWFKWRVSALISLVR
jgi:hypothetical protein